MLAVLGAVLVGNVLLDVPESHSFEEVLTLEFQKPGFQNIRVVVLTALAELKTNEKK